MAKEAMKLSVDTGAVVIDIDDRGERIGQFRFNPSDLDIVKRYGKVVEALSNIDIPEDPGEDEIFRISDEIKKQFDYLLNYEVSKEIFAKCNPLTPISNGDLYCENVLEGIAGIIEKTMNERISKKQANIRKATAKYHK